MPLLFLLIATGIAIYWAAPVFTRARPGHRQHGRRGRRGDRDRARGRPLTPGHGAPLRLIAPVKLGLKNIKAITSIAYRAEEPADYWSERGDSKYDGI